MLMLAAAVFILQHRLEWLCVGDTCAAISGSIRTNVRAMAMKNSDITGTMRQWMGQ